MADTRHKNVTWNVGDTTWDGVKVAVLMDIRDELQKLNRVFECHNFLAIPSDLRAIRRNTNKPRRKKR